MKRLLAAVCMMLVALTATARDLTADAKALAGLDPSVLNPAFLETWRAHKDVIGPQWDDFRRERLAKIQQWRSTELKDNQCKTMLYPFSGPDFLNAYAMFPNCDTYVFFGLEHPGNLPQVGKMGKKQLEALFLEFQDALGDIFERNYFITKTMYQQLHTPQMDGVTPIIGASMVVLGLEIRSIEYKQGTRMMKIVFFNPQTQKEQTLIYYSVDATNDALKKSNPDFLDIIFKTKPSYTLLKSASYLLHAPEFTNVRDTILNTTTLLVQDDTGVPYKFLTKRNIMMRRVWEIKLYGQYDKPIPVFNYGYQPDLEKAYKVSPFVQPLPFSFGYHWREGKSGLIIARKIR